MSLEFFVIVATVVFIASVVYLFISRRVCSVFHAFIGMFVAAFILFIVFSIFWGSVEGLVAAFLFLILFFAQMVVFKKIVFKEEK